MGSRDRVGDAPWWRPAPGALLSLIGGIVGVVAGVIATAIYAPAKGWATVIPAAAWAAGIGATFAIGGLAGLLPALRAARLPPTEALWSI